MLKETCFVSPPASVSAGFGTTTHGTSEETVPWMVELPGFVPSADVLRRLSVTWGIQPMCVPDVSTTEAMVLQVDRTLRESGVAVPGDRVVIVAGAPRGVPGSTNLMRVLLANGLQMVKESLSLPEPRQ